MEQTSLIGEEPAGPVDTWVAAQADLDAQGYAVLPGLLSPAQCQSFAARYEQEHGYRSRIVMARHHFGRGEYKYFSYPLPELLDDLRHRLYRELVPIANRWQAQLGLPAKNYPAELDAFLAQCHGAGQTRPTPLILSYGPDDYNCLHQDLYGDLVFPLQAAILLSQPGVDFGGGEFVMTETASDGQTPHVVPMRQGDAVVFAVNARPAPGKRGVRRVNLRHGVSRIRSGYRHTLGVIFHDAR